MAFIPYRDRPPLLAALATLTELVQQPVPTVRCGDSDPDPAVEANVVSARADTGRVVDQPQCGGRLMVLTTAYRCAECGRWFHLHCIQAHFAAHTGTGAS